MLHHCTFPLVLLSGIALAACASGAGGELDEVSGRGAAPTELRVPGSAGRLRMHAVQHGARIERPARDLSASRIAASRERAQVAPSSSTGPGSLLWQDRFAGGFDPTANVAVGGSRVFVAGRAPLRPGDDAGWLVKGYEARTGAVLWQDAVLGFTAEENKAGAIALAGDRVFVGGFTSATEGRDDATLRVYDTATGALRWEDRFSYGGGFASINSLATGQGDDDARSPALLYAVGRGTEADDTTAWFVRAYEPRSGALVWSDVFHPSAFDDAASVAVDRGRIFVSGFEFDEATQQRHFTVLAYDARTGAALWQDVVPGGTPGFFGSDVATQVVADGHRVLAAGLITDADGYHFAVRAYDAATGALRWSDLLDTGSGLDTATSIALDHGRAYVVGEGGAACSFDLTSDCDWLIRTYDQDTGALLWQKEVDFGHQDDQPNVVLACADHVAVAGLAGTDTLAPYGDWLVQVYNTRNGALRWQDRLPTPGTFAFPVALAAAGNRLFVSGSTLDLAGGTQVGDYIVRSYQLGNDDDECSAISNRATGR
jgi:hypothetical protein